MRTKALLAAYGAALALLTGGAYAAGSAVGPFSPVPGGHGHSGTGAAGTQPGAAGTQPGGLASSIGGYSLTPTDAVLTVSTAGASGEFSYRITGSDGAAVTAFDVENDKRMHLIVVRRDTTGFQHVHPEMAIDGTWRVPLALPAPGTYRVFADFTPTGGEPTTLGVDVSAPGAFEPVTHQPSRTAEVDGYTVDLTGDPVPGEASTLRMTVRKDGQPVTDLQPYLAAYGHLVVLRESDLAYLHVHPTASAGGAPIDTARSAGGAPIDTAAPGSRASAGPDIEFVAEVPTAGSYRLFLDFSHGGVVRTAEFTVPTTGHGH